MCGAETSSPKTIKVEGAKLDVCADCTDFGTEVRQTSSSGSSTKYSTGSSSSSSSSSSGDSSSTGGTGSSSSSSSSQRRSDMFDDMDELATDYDERVRTAREQKGLSQSDLANELNEKASLIRKIERGDTLPSDRVQSKLERFLEIDLSAEGSSGDDSEWSGGSSSGSYTLGDVVKRKD
ncbi:transcriptional regulator, XRE family [Halopiger xanaduensis SH-6]|uniref:Transcriptional regulator, XRE family n=2 Tax=Halopiger xanaduensis TaxID=387343 RepID=F8DBK1_HALXS|nr:multiprotein bridging factor aMBF1 [Halopiger xanaduensis]AEH37126.1 transcriptional regulator, XRE family [Halopiger xanaduensis SH-6]